jgi:hypothetical protein
MSRERATLFCVSVAPGELLAILTRALRRPKEARMTVSAVSHYRGGTIEQVTPVAKKLKAAYLKHGIVYRLSRFETGPNAGDWFVIVTFADQVAYDKAHAAITQDSECQQAFAEIATFAKRVSRELVVDLDL